MTVQPYLPYLVTGTSVMTDDIYVDYGGQTGTSTPAQRNASYMIAEQFAIKEIGTFLVPTTISGTFAWPTNGSILSLPHTHIRSVTGLTAIHEAGCTCTSVELAGCAWIKDFRAGIIDLRECGGRGGGAPAIACGCSSAGGYGEPIQYQIVYSAGIEAGTVAANPSSLMGLTTAAELALDQILDPHKAEGGPGDPSLTNFSDTGYSATRQFLVMSAFGGSPRANYAARMLSPLKFNRAKRL